MIGSSTYKCRYCGLEHNETECILDTNQKALSVLFHDIEKASERVFRLASSHVTPVELSSLMLHISNEMDYFNERMIEDAKNKTQQTKNDT